MASDSPVREKIVPLQFIVTECKVRVLKIRHSYLNSRECDYLPVMFKSNVFTYSLTFDSLA